MNPKTQRTLLWTSVALLILGGAVGAPEAGVLATGLSALCGLAPLLFGAGSVRLIAMALVSVAIGLTIAMLPAAQKSMDQYANRAQQRQAEARARAVKPAEPAPVPPVSR